MLPILLSAVLLSQGPLVPAYIGPGAGFALGGSFLFALAGLLLAFFAVLAWPLRVAVRTVRGRGRRRRARGTHGAVERVVVLGLDGFDPNNRGSDKCARTVSMVRSGYGSGTPHCAYVPRVSR